MYPKPLFLFVSFDGMTDPLGQSQVLPYLTGLSNLGFKIGIVSCEKKEAFQVNQSIIEAIVKSHQIDWNYCFYETGKPILSQNQNYRQVKNIVKKQIEKHHQQVVLHCRSYMSGLIGLHFKREQHIPFIFDMRGFWADERIEGKIWTLKNPITYALYRYFKKKEKQMFSESNAIVSLTEKAKQIILSWGLNVQEQKISVIPCCADLKHFSKENLDQNVLKQYQDSLSQLANKFVLSYIGSLGTWYMSDEMLEFFKVLSQKKDSVFLVITKDEPEVIYQSAKRIGIKSDQIIVKQAARKEVPYYISLSDASVFFIRPSFSKSASSPTKMGEILAMGVPVITNAGVGDVDQIILDTQCGVLISEFNQSAYDGAIHQLATNYQSYQQNTIPAAHHYFSLKEGIEKYHQVYSHLLSENSKK